MSKLSLEGVDFTKLLDFVKNDVDGWSIFDPGALTDIGFNADSVKTVSRVHRSNTSDYKETIYHNGKIVPQTEGVYGLTFLYALGEALGVETKNAYSGRGFQAQFLQSVLIPEITKRLMEVPA